MNQSGSEMIKNKEYETYELLYKETGTMFRHFLNWRRLLFAGYLAVLSTLALAFKWTLACANSLSFVCPAAGVVISLVFWGLDYRNRTLFMHAANVGKTLEEKLGLPYTGYYGAYKEDKSKITHGSILTVFYIVCTVIMLVLASLLFLES
jgi:hypothetical protein